MSVSPVVSPLVALLGGRIEEWGQERVRVALQIEKRHTNPMGIVHGGVITTLMDEAIGQVIAAARGAEAFLAAPHLSIEMNASFLLGAGPGDEIVAEGRVLRRGRSVVFGEAEVTRQSDGRLIAKGRFAFVIPERRE